MKRIFIIHGWGGHPKEGWLTWLGKELESRGFEVHIPEMPDTDNPQIKKWIPHLTEVVRQADQDTYFVGHSIGCQTIVRYVSSLNNKVGGMVLVAPWAHLPNIVEEEKEIARPWLETPIDFQRVRKNCGQVVAIFSDDDPEVPMSDAPIFEKELGAQIIVEHEKGHFNESDEVWELPEALNAVLEISK